MNDELPSVPLFALGIGRNRSEQTCGPRSDSTECGVKINTVFNHPAGVVFLTLQQVIKWTFKF